MLSDAQASAMMQRVTEQVIPEVRKDAADNLLCSLLIQAGYPDTVEAYRRIKKLSSKS